MSLLLPEALFTQTATETPFVPGELALSVWVSLSVNTPLGGLTLASTLEGRKSRRLKTSSWLVAGLNRVSFCFEIFDREIFKEVCPGKDAEYGLDHYLAAVQYCAALGRKAPRSEPWVTNGEIIAGLEPPESSIRAIDWITSVGAIPTVCVFRPTVGSDMEHWPPPDFNDMRHVLASMYDACRRHHVPIGLAPNIEVSLVVNPDDAALLAARTPQMVAYELWRRALRIATRPVFARRMRASRRRCAEGTHG